jgi:hypothetical protein
MNGKKARAMRKIALMMYIKSITAGKKKIAIDSIRTIYRRLKVEYRIAKSQGLL